MFIAVVTAMGGGTAGQMGDVVRRQQGGEGGFEGGRIEGHGIKARGLYTNIVEEHGRRTL